MTAKMKAKAFDRNFDAGEKIIDQLDLSKARRVRAEAMCVKVDLPTWMVQGIDREARRLGVTRQSLIKLWLGDRLAQTGQAASVRD